MTTEREEWKARDGVVSSHGGNGPIIAVAYGMDDATADERARRIAAVPDMEEALMEVERQMSGSSAFNPWDTGPSAVLVLVRAALRKAGQIP